MVTIIPARGGSKGLPGKNLRTFCGKPLLAWSILQAPKPVYVSSDNVEILLVAEAYGAIPIKRPDELATDEASSESALAHVLACIDEPQEIIFLPPTAPLRYSHDIIRALQIFRKSGADSLFSSCELQDFCGWTEQDGQLRGLTFDPMNRGRRQDRKPIYLENGSIYIFKPKLLQDTGNRLGGKIVRYPMQFWQSFEIDDQETFDLCEWYFKRHGLDQ